MWPTFAKPTERSSTFAMNSFKADMATAAPLVASSCATVTLWKRCGVKVVPGAYLAQPGPNGINPGDGRIRVALVHDPATIREALQRIVSVLS